MCFFTAQFETIMVDGMSRANGPKVKKRNVATKCILLPGGTSS